MTEDFNTIDPYVRRQEIASLTGIPVAVTNKASGGSIGSAATTVDIASAINVNQTTASQTLTVPAPTNTAEEVRVFLNNVGSTSFTALSTVIAPGAGIQLVWTGSAYNVIGTSAGAANVTVVGGKTFTVNNTVTLAGTDGTTMTFPSTSATIARTDAANTFTGVQTMTSPVLVTPTLGVASATTINKLTITAPATGATLVIADGKTVTQNNTITYAGTDGTTMTFPSTSATLARTDAANTFTGVQTMTSPVLTTPAIGVATGTSFAATGAITSSGTAGIGYATGAGGTVTQSTDKTTTVVLNKISGAITMNNASLAANAAVVFTLTNSTIAAGDVVVFSVKSGASTGIYRASAASTGAGTCTVVVTNAGSTASEAVVLNFVVIKGVSA